MEAVTFGLAADERESCSHVLLLFPRTTSSLRLSSFLFLHLHIVSCHTAYLDSSKKGPQVLGVFVSFVEISLEIRTRRGLQFDSSTLPVVFFVIDFHHDWTS